MLHIHNAAYNVYIIDSIGMHHRQHYRQHHRQYYRYALSTEYAL